MHLAYALVDFAELGDTTATERADLLRETEEIAGEIACKPVADRVAAAAGAR